MEKLKLLKREVEKILQGNHTSKENRLAFANGVIYALANVTTGLKGKEYETSADFEYCPVCGRFGNHVE